MQFSVSELRAVRELEVEQDLSTKILGEPPTYVEFPRPLHTKVRARYLASDISVSGSVHTTMTFTCARCLEKFSRPIDSQFEQHFEHDLATIDVTPEIRESVIVDIPLIATCKEDCKGICPTCGVNRNTTVCRCDAPPAHAAWNALKNVKFKSK